LLATDKQAADILNETTNKLARWRKDGGGPPFVMVGKRARYPLDDLERWVASLRRFASLAEAYAHDRQRAEAADHQRTALAGARKTRWTPKEPATESTATRSRRKKRHAPKERIGAPARPTPPA
jgi:hypothetical protein